MTDHDHPVLAKCLFLLLLAAAIWASRPDVRAVLFAAGRSTNAAVTASVGNAMP